MQRFLRGACVDSLMFRDASLHLFLLVTHRFLHLASVTSTCYVPGLPRSHTGTWKPRFWTLLTGSALVGPRWGSLGSSSEKDRCGPFLCGVYRIRGKAVPEQGTQTWPVFPGPVTTEAESPSFRGRQEPQPQKSDALTES